MKKEILGIDLGGTNICGGTVSENHLSQVVSNKIPSNASAEEMLQALFHFVDKLITPATKAIGIGVPGLVIDRTVYDVVNIPSWQEISLHQLIEQHYHLPVAVNNDANCFALGEFYFGKGKGHDSMLGITIGTGLGTGIIINQKLFSGNNGGAGEFGMIEYLDSCYEYYASGQFFSNVYNIDGELVFENAQKGNVDALGMYEEMGIHLGNAIKTMLYATDIPLIVLGGSVSKAFPFFSKAMWKQIQTFAYKKALDSLQLQVSELHNSGILGAAALCYELL